jgi:hypothetical protein
MPIIITREEAPFLLLAVLGAVFIVTPVVVAAAALAFLGSFTVLTTAVLTVALTAAVLAAAVLATVLVAVLVAVLIAALALSVIQTLPVVITQRGCGGFHLWFTVAAQGSLCREGGDHSTPDSDVLWGGHTEPTLFHDLSAL